MTDKPDLAAVGKLGEEACELGARLFRAVIQGLDGVDPEKRRSNIDLITDEIADVLAMTRLAIDYLGLDEDIVAHRAEKKAAFKKVWLDELARGCS